MQATPVIEYVELFCGCGGMAAGLRDAGGWECRLAVDHDPYALEVYAANFPTHATLRHDLNEPLGDAVPADVRAALRKPGGMVVGGSPCQDFALTCTPSKRLKGERAQLTRAFARHVADLRPQWVVFENVKYAAHRTQFLEFVDDLHALGYVTEHRILSMRDLGMAQPRYRLILLAHDVTGHPPDPKPSDETEGTEGTEGPADAQHQRALHRVQSVWTAIQAVFDRRPPVQTMRQTFEAYGAPTYGKNHVYYPVPRALAVQPSIFSLDDRGERRALFTVRGRTRPMPSTYEFRDKDSTHDRSDVFAIQTVHIKALQGFPPAFAFHGPKGKQDQAIGNAVPPPLTIVVGRALASVIAG